MSYRPRTPPPPSRSEPPGLKSRSSHPPRAATRVADPVRVEVARHQSAEAGDQQGQERVADPPEPLRVGDARIPTDFPVETSQTRTVPSPAPCVTSAHRARRRPGGWPRSRYGVGNGRARLAPIYPASRESPCRTLQFRFLRVDSVPARTNSRPSPPAAATRRGPSDRVHERTHRVVRLGRRGIEAIALVVPAQHIHTCNRRGTPTPALGNRLRRYRTAGRRSPAGTRRSRRRTHREPEAAARTEMVHLCVARGPEADDQGEGRDRRPKLEHGCCLTEAR